MTTRCPTEQDFLNNKTFCVVRASIDRCRIHVNVSSRTLKITKGPGGQYYLSSHGAIDAIQLGQFQLLSAGSYSLSGSFIGYSEDEATLLESAKEYLEQKRLTFIEHLKSHITDFEMAKLKVEPA